MRRTRTESRQQNRREVLDAARCTFLELGYHGATVDAIALAAGFSKGVVYSQFGSKDDLFLALLEERIEERRHRGERVAAGLQGPEGFHAIAVDATQVTAESLAWQTLLLEFRAHAARDPVTLARYTELHERAIAGVADLLDSVFSRAGLPPPLPPRTLAVIWLAIGTGLAAELLTDPGLDTEAIARHLAGGLVATARSAI
jgi:AcrR family transcriptional regulator